MRTMHLFAGAGGGLLADLILGHKPVIAVEWDRYACTVLRERAAEGWFPDLHVWDGDVRLFEPSDYAGRVDCIHAGFPCQDVSVAGKQAGLGEGTRSGLYREVIRIASDLQPRYIFLENVPGIINNGLEQVIGDLSSIGYDARWATLRASSVGAWHRRNRWWCLATNSQRDGGEGGKPKSLQGKQVLPWQQNVRGIEDLRNRPNLPKPLIRGVRDGFPHYLDQLKAIGNGQVPLQAATAFRMLEQLF